MEGEDIRRHERINGLVPGDMRYKYRHEIPGIFVKMRDMEEGAYLEFQKERWTCPDCSGIIHFYKYRCSDCGKEVIV